MIKKAWELFLTGAYTVSQILDKLNNEWGYRTPLHKKLGGKPMSKSSLYRVFNDTFYYGPYEYPGGSGNWHQGKHELMITEEEFWIAQKLLGQDGRPRPKHHTFAFTGLMRCGECEGSITAELKKKFIKSENKIRVKFQNRT